MFDLLKKVKVALRVSTNDDGINDEITDLISSARLDLIQSGVSKLKAQSDEDALIQRAIILYAKSQFGIDNPHAERYWQSYESLKKHLSYSGDYRG
ncbi:phage head-tail connector protein [Bacillus norwichensis]|uniref:phage head-tail connector protein n=1 Tax=Bacillus norwichensis TaxID=2762217 RepID=UPI003850D528